MADDAAELIKNLNALIQRGEETEQLGQNLGGLPPPAQRPGIGAARGIGLASKTPPAAGGGGIASPLTEQSRTLHTTQAVSSDGLFVWSVPDTITMLDGLGNTVQFVYAEP